jgi:hypothetical protein
MASSSMKLSPESDKDEKNSAATASTGEPRRSTREASHKAAQRIRFAQLCYTEMRQASLCVFSYSLRIFSSAASAKPSWTYQNQLVAWALQYAELKDSPHWSAFIRQPDRTPREFRLLLAHYVSTGRLKLPETSEDAIVVSPSPLFHCSPICTISRFVLTPQMLNFFSCVAENSMPIEAGCTSLSELVERRECISNWRLAPAMCTFVRCAC